jgi:hypothetical protein
VPGADQRDRYITATVFVVNRLFSLEDLNFIKAVQPAKLTITRLLFLLNGGAYYSVRLDCQSLFWSVFAMNRPMSLRSNVRPVQAHSA